MGQPWIKTVDGWQPALPLVRTSTGWNYANYVYEKTGASTWTLRWQRDTTPPAQLAALSISYNSTAKQITISATAPSSSDMKSIRLKLSRTGYISSSTPSGDGYITTIQPDGTKWSEPNAGPSQTVTRTSYVTEGYTYYVTGWAIDTFNNVSAIRQVSYKVPVPAAPAPTTVTKSAYFTASDSASFTNTYNNWRTSDNYVYQAGEQNWRGLWMYGTKITSALRNAKRITDMRIYIGRVNSSHGVAGAANVRLGMHKYASQPSGDPILGYYDLALVGTLNRGQYATFTVPSSAWGNILDGSYRGFGLHYGTTSYTDNDYMIAYGAGTNSGRLWIEWEE